MDMFGETDAGCGPDAPVDQPAGHDCEPAPPAEDAAPGRETCEGAVARLADGGVTMQALDDACEAIDRLDLPREEVERRWPSLAVVIFARVRRRVGQPELPLGELDAVVCYRVPVVWDEAAGAWVRVY